MPDRHLAVDTFARAAEKIGEISLSPPKKSMPGIQESLVRREGHYGASLLSPNTWEVRAAVT